MEWKTVKILLLAAVLAACFCGCAMNTGNVYTTREVVGYVDVLVANPWGGYHIERRAIVVERTYWVWVSGPNPYWEWRGPYLYPGWVWYGPGHVWRWHGPHHLRPHNHPPGPPHRGHHR